MLPLGLTSPNEVVAHYDKVYDDLIDSGKAYPFLYPQGSLGALAILLYLLIDWRRSRLRRLGSYVTYGFLLAFQVWCIVTNRARNPAAAFGVGLISSFGLLWVGAIMIANDCQRDFRRIERAGQSEVADAAGLDGQTDTVVANGHAKSLNGHAAARRRTSNIVAHDTHTKGPSQRHGLLYWQSYPSGPLRERLDWIADVFCSFRGVGWTWQTNGVPPPPDWVQAQLQGRTHVSERAEPPKISKTGIRRYGDRHALVRDCAVCLAFGYFALDAVKTLGIRDPYMWGYMEAPPPGFLPSVVRSSSVMTKSYRLLVSLTAIYTALWTIFKMGPVFFSGLLGPRVIGLRGEAFMNPADMFGDFWLVFDQGLAGWWGAFWHQTFRFGFEQPSLRLLDVLNIDKRSATGRLVSVFVAFLLSGCLHASGSHTQLGDTRPILGPMRFFMLQAFAITAQTLATQQLKAAGLTQRLPKVAKQVCNFAVVHVWLYHTAPLLVDDFARGGIWLFEPVPISIFRGLGLGPKGTGWWCWNSVARWRSGNHWWDTGIAL